MNLSKITIKARWIHDIVKYFNIYNIVKLPRLYTSEHIIQNITKTIYYIYLTGSRYV